MLLVPGCGGHLVAQVQQECTLAGWGHSWVALVPSVLTGHKACSRQGCCLDTVSLMVVAPCGHMSILISQVDPEPVSQLFCVEAESAYWAEKFSFDFESRHVLFKSATF